MKKKSIMIDLDDTICSGGYLEIVNEYLKTDYSYDSVENYYFEELIPGGINDDYVDFFYSHNVYDYVKFFDDSYSVLERLSEKYDICICSSYVNDNVGIEKSGIHLQNKFNFLFEKFPFLDSHNFIFTSRKDLVNCDIKIDDKLSNLDGYGEIKLLFDARHNRSISDSELEEKGVRRVYSWKEIEEILL